MEYGWVMLFILAIMGGIIAYLGDKIGSRVGKQKIKLFGMRPKYSSICITILTGICIAAVTLGVMSILSENVRIALFGMHQLQMQKAQLEAQKEELLKQAAALGKELQDKNTLIAKNETLLKEQQEQLDGKNEQIRLTQLDLQQAQEARDSITQQLSVVQVALDEAKAGRDKAENDKILAEKDRDEAQAELAALEQTKTKMMETIQVLDQRIKLLNDTMTNIREGTVMFRVGEVLSSFVISGGLTDEQTKEELSQGMSQTNTMIARHLGIKDEHAILLYIAPDEFNAAVTQLRQSKKDKKLVRIIAAGNIMVGEPALVHVEVYDNNLIYRRGETVFEEQLSRTDMDGNAELQVMRFLHDVNQQAQLRGLLPDPLTGKVGALTATEMFDTITKLKTYSGTSVVLRATTLDDTYTAGPLRIDITVEPAALQ